MTIINRRTALTGIASLPAATVAGIAAANAEPNDPYALIEHHAYELAKAMKAVHDDVNFYHVDHELGFVICSKGMRRGIRIGGAS